MLISERDQETLRNHFDENLGNNVEMVMFTEKESPIIVPGKQPCETCAQTEQLLEEVAALSDKLTLTVHELSSSSEVAAGYGIDRVPAFVLNGAARGRVRFFGIPSGYEFSSFISDLLDTAAGTTDLSEETRSY
ncbi:MAG TPA: thioredoxin family protein, partial [Blastocatellia bacterium]|nr:thioredoxin family protein [Blastocatellia bacterium]